MIMLYSVLEQIYVPFFIWNPPIEILKEHNMWNHSKRDAGNRTNLKHVSWLIEPQWKD